MAAALTVALPTAILESSNSSASGQPGRTDASGTSGTSGQGGNQASTGARTGTSGITTLPLGVPTQSPSGVSESPSTTAAAGAQSALAMGQADQVTEDGKAELKITVTGVTVSSSTSNGVTPENGYFAIFTVTAKNTSTSEDYGFSPEDFYVQTPSGVHFNDYSGHGATANEQSGALQGQTLKPKQVVTGTIAIDETSQHGTFVYALSAQPVGSWTF